MPISAWQTSARNWECGLPDTFRAPLVRRDRRRRAARGQVSLEHLYTLFDGALTAGVKPEQMVDTITRFRKNGAADPFAGFAKSGTSFTTTLVIERAGIHL